VKDTCRDAGDSLPADVPEGLVRAILAARARRSGQARGPAG